MTKKLLMGLLFLFAATMPLSLANGMHEEEATVRAQLNELLPFEHLSEGHWFAFLLSTILWISLLYAIYSLVQLLMQKRK